MATGPYIRVKLSPQRPPSHPRQSHSSRKRTTKFLAILSALVFALLLFYLKPTGAITYTSLVLEPVDLQHSDPRIAKATILYDEGNDILTEALKLHESGGCGGCEVHVLKQPIVKGFADQLLWLHEVVVKELRKGSEERVEWVVWFDTSSVLPTSLSPSIPLQRFLPPLPSVDSETFKTLSIIATKPDHEHISSNLLFLRVSGLTLRILTLALAAPYTDPEREWGKEVDVVAATLQFVLEKAEYRSKVLYQPAEWYNGTGAVFTQPWAASPVEKLHKIRKLLMNLNSYTAQADLEQGPHPSAADVELFYATITEAKHVLNEARNRGHTEEAGEFVEEVRVLRYAIEARSWDVEGLRVGLEKLKARLGIGEVVGFEAVVG